MQHFILRRDTIMVHTYAYASRVAFVTWIYIHATAYAYTAPLWVCVICGCVPCVSCGLFVCHPPWIRSRANKSVLAPGYGRKSAKFRCLENRDAENAHSRSRNCSRVGFPSVRRDIFRILKFRSKIACTTIRLDRFDRSWKRDEYAWIVRRVVKHSRENYYTRNDFLPFLNRFDNEKYLE